MTKMKTWQKVAYVVFGIAFLMFFTNAITHDDPVLWVYPAVALFGIFVTWRDTAGRKQRREEEEAERRRADEEEAQRAKRLARRNRRKK